MFYQLYFHHANRPILSEASLLYHLIKISIFFVLLCISFGLLALPVKINTDTDFYLFSLYISDHTLSDDLLVYKVDKKLYVEAQSFFDAVEFPVQVRPEAIYGWYLKEDLVFNANISNAKVIAGDRKYPINKEDIVRDSQGVVYMSLDAIEKWFEMSSRVNTNSQKMWLDANYEFPIEKRNKRATQKLSSTKQDRSQYILTDKYRWATVPNTDINAFLTYQKNDDYTQYVKNLGITSSFDLLKHSTFYTGSVSQNGVTQSNQRLTFKRQANRPGNDMFLGTNFYEFGDIFLYGSGLVADNGTGTGISLNRNRNRISASQLNNSVTIEGDAVPGWQAELYRNNQLLGFTTVNTDGRYIFQTQEISAGENLFLVKLYGPQGQYREVIETIWGGGYNLAANDYRYNFTAIDFSEKLIDTDPDNYSAGLHAQTLSQFDLSYAITNNLELGGGIHDVKLNSMDGLSNHEYYYSTLIRYNTPVGVFIGNGTQQQGEGRAWKFDYLGSFYQQSFTLTHEKYNDFTSPYTLKNPNLESLSGLSFYGRLPWKSLNSYSFITRHLSFGTSSSRSIYNNRLSGKLGRVSYSNFLTYTDSAFNKDFTGKLKLSANYKNLRFGSEFFYDIKGDDPVTQTNVSINWSPWKDVYNKSSLSKQFINNKDIVIKNETSWNHEEFSVTFSAQGDSNDNYYFSIGVNFALGYDYSKKRFYASRQSLANSGRVDLNFFQDNNNNGKMDNDEFYVDQKAYEIEKNTSPAEGLAAGDHFVPAWGKQTIRASDLHLKHPYLISSDEYIVNTHSGSYITQDVPLIPSCDVEGNIHQFFSDMDVEIDLDKIQVQLKDNETGEIVYTTTAEFDGYFAFHQVPVGQYILSVAQKGAHYVKFFKVVNFESKQSFYYVKP